MLFHIRLASLTLFRRLEVWSSLDDMEYKFQNDGSFLTLGGRVVDDKYQFIVQIIHVNTRELLAIRANLISHLEKENFTLTNCSFNDTLEKRTHFNLSPLT